MLGKLVGRANPNNSYSDSESDGDIDGISDGDSVNVMLQQIAGMTIRVKMP